MKTTIHYERENRKNPEIRPRDVYRFYNKCTPFEVLVVALAKIPAVKSIRMRFKAPNVLILNAQLSIISISEGSFDIQEKIYAKVQKVIDKYTEFKFDFIIDFQDEEGISR